MQSIRTVRHEIVQRKAALASKIFSVIDAAVFFNLYKKQIKIPPYLSAFSSTSLSHIQLINLLKSFVAYRVGELANYLKEMKIKEAGKKAIVIIN